MIETARKLLVLLDRKERRDLAVVLAFVILSGALDMVGVASVLPFLAVVSNPDLVEEQPILATLYQWSGVNEIWDFVLFLGLGAFALIVISGVVRGAALHLTARFTRLRSLTLSMRLMEHYLRQPYVWFLSRHSSDLGRSILSEVEQVVAGPLTSLMQFAASTFAVLFLVGFLVLYQPYAALGAAVVLGGCYALIFLVARRRLVRLGDQRLVANRERFQAMQEVMGGIKTIKIMNLERTYLSRYRSPADRLARIGAALQVMTQMPRYVLEVAAFGGVILFVLWLLRDGSGVADLIPVLGVYALAAARLFPALQQLFRAMSAGQFGNAALAHIYRELTSEKGAPLGPETAQRTIPLHRSMELRDIAFSFPDSSAPAVKNVSFTIEARTTLGIVGSTGAGKTTILDIILGLLEPQSGSLIVDGTEIDASCKRDWQRCIGYVPQEIFLVEDTLAANIAFGVAPEEIDAAAVERASRAARLHEFVTGKLPRGYDTMIGERGTRLSGGQRQRVGIARALYADPDVLIFDEATSALDTMTERAVMEAMAGLRRQKTIILVAHRLSTVRNCDRIVVMEDGEVVGDDDYDGLLDKNRAFQALAAAS